MIELGGTSHEWQCDSCKKWWDARYDKCIHTSNNYYHIARFYIYPRSSYALTRSIMAGKEKD